MSRSRTLAAIGVSDQEVAHLRLLMRTVADRLDHVWRWGEEHSADLLIVDLDTFAGQMAHTRALGSGLRCAVIADEPPAGTERVLRRPLRSADVIALLNGAAHARAHDPAIGAHGADFYTRDLDDHGSAAGALSEAAPAPGLDELLRHRPVELRAPPPPSVPPPAAASVPAETKNSLRARRLSVDDETCDLRTYLESGRLLAPARFALPDAPPLVLDPKHRVAHAPASLRALEPYCRARWPLADAQPLTSVELAVVRSEQPALPYARLIWLYVLVHSGGRLASHLDPGGTYRLTQWVEMDRDFGGVFRIASALLRAARLHEIAAAADAPMDEVFDVVNAYEAIGLIEWQPRPRRDDDAPRPPSLLQRLRRPFGKS